MDEFRGDHLNFREAYKTLITLDENHENLDSPEVQGDENYVMIQEVLGIVELGVTRTRDPSASVEPDEDRN